MRQIDAKTPSEDLELVEEWRKDEELPIFKITSKEEQYEHYKRPMEIDAELFAYCFVARTFEIRVSLSYINDKYINDLKDYYFKLFQETDEELFS